MDNSSAPCPRKRPRWPTSRATILAVFLLLAPLAQSSELVRAKRDVRGTESLLTVEWEGIQSGDHPDSSIRGFIVEYRAEKDNQWNVHAGVIPYKGPNHQYRVQIPKLPTGISYFVRIKVLGDKNEVLVETPEIRARNEIVSIKCDGDEITAPRDLDVKERGKYSVALSWSPPECGSVGEYQIELRGLKNERFDVHRMTVAQPSASVTNLLSGTEYVVRIRAVDRSHATSPWNEELITVSTKGEVPEASSEIKAEYRSDQEVRIRWKHLDDERLQHYEVVLVEFQDDAPQRIERARVEPEKDSFHFNELSPNSDYEVGVIAYVDHEPRRVYRLVFSTTDQPISEIDETPVVVGAGTQYTVHWKKPATELPVKKFIVEFKPDNSTRWERVNTDRDFNGEDSFSVETNQLDKAFAVRVVLVGDAEKALATTKSVLVHDASPNNCNSVAGIPKNVKAKATKTSLTFTWDAPECEGSDSSDLGYEYSIWKKEDGIVDETSFVPNPTVTIDDAAPETNFGFRVRTRLVNGHSPWSEIVETITSDAPEAENIYRLRIVLAPPRSYLVWTPLPEHEDNIASFKLSYKKAEEDKWVNVHKPASFFKCPKNVAATPDFCYDLRDLEYGQQYTSDLIYELKSGDWTSHGSPLFFILVEAEGQDDIIPSGEGSQTEAQAPAQDLSVADTKIQDLGAKISVAWSVKGDQSKVRAYQVEQKPEKEEEWKPFGNYVPASESQTIYKQLIDRSALLSSNAELRVRAIGANAESLVLSAPQLLSNKCERIQKTPENVLLTVETAKSIKIRWDYPADSGDCGLYFVISGMIDNGSIQQTVNGKTRELFLEVQNPSSVELKVSAANKIGPGPATEFLRIGDGPQPPHLDGQQQAAAPTNGHISRGARGAGVVNTESHHRVRRSICDPRTDFWCREGSNFDGNPDHARGALVSTPHVSQGREGGLTVHWKSTGNGRGVFGYRVLYRSDSTGWNPYGQIVPYVGDNESYSQALTSLVVGGNYKIQIQALDRNSYVLFTSPEVSAQSTCQPPSRPPSHVTVDAPDARHVRLTWVQPPQNTWNCGEISYEIQVDEPRIYAEPIKVEGRLLSHVFMSQPGQQWVVRVRTANSAGASPWSTSVSTSASSSSADLIEGPFVSTTGGVPRITWKAVQNAPDTLANFRVEWKPQTQPTWNIHRQQIPYSGWQRPYAVDLADLPQGNSYEVRVKGIDNRGVEIVVSPTISVQTSRQCYPPRRPPTNVLVTPLGPNQIRLSWEPISEAEWNCNSLWYVVKYSSPETQGYKNVTNGETSVVFDSKPYTQWQFEVQAANSAGSSGWSRNTASQTLTTSPGAVSDVQVYPSHDSIQLSWRPPQNPNGQIVGYEVTYQLVNKGMCENSAGTVQTVMSQGPTYRISGLQPHSKYRIGVAARTNIAGERVTREVQTEPSVPTAAPAYIRVDTVGDTSAAISWHAPPCVHTNGDISEYEYEVIPADRYSVDQRFTDTIRTTRVELHNLQPGTKYKFKIRAYTSRGAGPWSPDVVFQTSLRGSLVVPPPAQVISTGPTDAHLVWQTTPGTASYFDKFKCQYAPAGTQQYQQRTFPAYSPCDTELIRRQQLPPSTPSAQTHCGRIDNLQPNTPYDFQVSAKPKQGPWTPWSPPQRTQPVEGPVKILSLTKTGGSTSSLRFAWTVTQSDLLRCTAFRITVTPRDRSEPPRTFTVDGHTFQYQVDGLRPNTVYAVTVEASTNARYYPGVTVDMSTDAEQIFGVDQRPRIIEEKSSSITLGWDVSSRIRCSNFIVEYKLENGAWQQYDRRVPCDHGRTSYTSTVQNLPTNSVVDFRVIAISDRNQPTTPSPEVRGHTKCSAPDQPPQAVRADAPSTNEVRVSWARPAKNTWNCDQLNIEIGYRIGDGPEQIVPVSGERTDYTFPSEPNTRWTIRVRSSNQVGHSPWSAPQTVTTRQGAPGAVMNLRLTPKSPNEIFVQWSPPSQSHGSIVGYDISYRLKHRLACPDEDPRDTSRDFVTIYNHKDLDYTLTGLLPNSLYEVKVRARTTEVGPEETKEAATLQQPPSAPPLNLQLTYALERSLSFQWEPVDCSQRHGEIINYEYEILGLDDWAKLERQIANTTNTQVTIDGLTPFTKYVMRVKAYNTIGGGPNTENLAVMTTKANAPLPPQDLVVTQEGTDFFVISWLPPYPPYGPHDSYKITYQLLSANQWENIEVSTKDPRLECPSVTPRFCFNITGLDSGQQYRVKVAARIEGGTYGPYSSVIIANTLQVLPDAPPRIDLIAKTDHSLHIRWTPPHDPHSQIIQYKITYKSLGDPYAKPQTVIVPHPKLDQLLDGLTPDTTYNITLSAGTKRGFGPEISTRYKTDVFKVPAVINAPTVTPDGAHALNVEWTGVHDTQNRINGYIIEFRNSDTPVWRENPQIVRHVPGKLQYNGKLTGLEPDTLYFVRIKVVDTKNNPSESSPEAQGRTGCAAPRSPPNNININSPSPLQVRVNWQPPAKDTWSCSSIRYRIKYTNGTRPGEVVVPGLENIFDSAPNAPWTVQIRTENDAGTSGWSEPLKIKTSDGIPGAVRDLNATPEGPNTAVVTFLEPEEPNGEITGYTIEYQLKSIGECGARSEKPITIHSKDKRINLENLLPDSTYEVRVTAHTTKAGPKSKPVLFTTEESEPTGQPRNLRVTSITSSRAELLWNEIECELRHGKILGYVYEVQALSPYGQNVTDRTTTHRVSLQDLAPFTQYRARVRGFNSKGEGPFSDWVNFQTKPAAPPPPTDLREEQVLDHALEISFLPPSPPNGILDFYKIRHTPTGRYNYKEVRVPAHELVCSDVNKRDRLCYRVSKLEPEQEYEIQAAAHTEGGDWSDWSEPLNTKTEQQNIPVLETGLELDQVRSTSISVKWKGLEPHLAEHIVGYILEYKSELDDEWQEHNGVVRHRARQNEYKATVRNLIESTEYFFRIRVVGKNDKRGNPSPELRATTKCGRPEEPPRNVQIQSVDFEHVKITWEPPEEETWKCDQVEFVIQYANTTSQGTINVPTDAPSELILDTLPGTKWGVKMQTQTIEEEPQKSKWSDRASLTTKSPPDEIFVQLEPKSPTQEVLTWDVPDADWPYGVDISYRLTKLGGCNKGEFVDEEPILLENVQEKTVLLDNLHPGSEYEVTVTPRLPPGLVGVVKPKKTVRKFKTEDDKPVGAPRNLRVDNRQDTKLGFSWEPPECAEQNGVISQYQYEIVGLDEWNKGEKDGISPRTKTEVTDLLPGSLYRFRVRAFTSQGEGPWSEPVDARTTGSEIGPPRELTTVGTKPTSIQITWLPPHPELTKIIAYKVKYSPRADDSRPVEVELSENELSCSGYESPILTGDSLCTDVTGLEPQTTYRFSVQAQAASGNWGPWSTEHFSTTKKAFDGPLGGSLVLLSNGHDNIKVRWTPPGVIGDNIEKYDLTISVASELDKNPKKYSTGGQQKEFHFKGLEPSTYYNVTVTGRAGPKNLWFISNNFPTTEKAEHASIVNIGPVTNLRVIDKSENMIHAAWDPPDIFEPEYRDLLTHYRVTLTPLDTYTLQPGASKNYTVPVPGTTIRFTDLIPETIYNITVQGGTEQGYGEPLWTTESTLPVGENNILKLKSRTPTTLTVEWEPVWGTTHRGYILTAKSLKSVYPHVRINTIKSFEINATATEFVIKGLEPSTTYNVTLQLKDNNKGAWGAWSTMPPGWFVPKNLRYCDVTNYAVSMSWLPVELDLATDYQVRYAHLNSPHLVWNEEPEKHKKYLLCPKDPCDRMCYVVFNLEHHPDEYAFQVRAKVDGVWNRWKTASKIAVSESPEVKANCCIVPPPYIVENIASPGTWWEVPIAPAATEKNITRYYVVVDQREPAGDTNWTMLTDKVTADRLKIPYYVAASFSTETLTAPTTVKIGDGKVYGGYINYPLVKGKTYNYEIYTKWSMNDGQPVIARLRETPFLTAGWPWWWILLFLLLLLLLILLCCLLAWCLTARKRRRERRYVNGQHMPLLHDEKYEARRTNFEDGYRHGYSEAGRLGSGSAARRHYAEEYSTRDDRFQEGRDNPGFSAGYMQGFRDGNSGVFGDQITTSLLNRLEEQYPNNEEYRAGYVDGFKDGVGGGKNYESKEFHKSLTELTERLTTLEKIKDNETFHQTKIYHVYNQNPETASYTATGQQLAQELDEITSGSRRSTLRRHYTPGDYLRYGSEAEGFNSLGRSRRSQSVSGLAREEAERRHHASGASHHREEASEERHEERQEEGAHETYASSSKRYNFKSRSDLNQQDRRYASQTLLDGARPGPIASHSRREALHSLQRELDNLSRSPAGGYSSDYAQETIRSRGGQRLGSGYSNYDYDSYNRSDQRFGSSVNFAEEAEAAATTSRGASVINIGDSGTSAIIRQSGSARQETGGGQVESVDERYERSYREEFQASSGAHQTSSSKQ
ncbi:unnamed protein product [Bursaphelenchus xylophilus]|uniref:(pine wood nematode) hypothetical protein n=1 Tax=Bursaphelenchus xylophilus TaxID=6326 RepID=A0A7I8WH78_BURXY|nr:unnamed protein product [Bursaphelenchus xylophilus]CAG9110067.1 unnamed protein product [Bursaphelenchus xylophilus]